MKTVKRFTGNIEYYPDPGCRFVRKDRTKVYPWFLTLGKSDSIDNYEELPISEAEQIEKILKERLDV